MKAQRIFAYIVDIILIGIVNGVLCAISGLEIQQLWATRGIAILYNPVMLMNLGISTVYFLMDVMSGGSPGKKLMGIIVTHGTGGSGFGTALTRSLVKVLSIHLLIGIILFLIGDAHSSLHDKAAGTSVQKKVVVAS